MRACRVQICKNSADGLKVENELGGGGGGGRNHVLLKNTMRKYVYVIIVPMDEIVVYNSYWQLI